MSSILSNELSSIPVSCVVHIYFCTAMFDKLSFDTLTVVSCDCAGVLFPLGANVTSAGVLSNLNIPDCTLVSFPKLSVAFI